MPIKFTPKKDLSSLKEEINAIEEELFGTEVSFNDDFDNEDKETEFDAIKVVDNKLLLINNKKNIIVDEYIHPTHEEAVKDFYALVDLLDLKIPFKNQFYAV